MKLNHFWNPKLLVVYQFLICTCHWVQSFERTYLSRKPSFGITPNVHASLRLFSTKSIDNGVELQSDGRVSLSEMLNGNPLNIPRLPIPALSDTLDRYLVSVRPFIKEEKEWCTHQALVKDFVKTVGPDLQKQIEDSDSENAKMSAFPHSFIEKLWFNMYLEGRWALPINNNAAFTLVKVKDFIGRPQLERCAKFTQSWLKFMLKIRSGRFSPSRRPAECVYQFPFQLGTARIPQEGVADILSHAPDSNHIVVLHQNNFYRIPVFDNDKVITVSDLQAKLEKIKAMSETAPKVPFVGIFTSTDRDTWALQRKQLISHSVLNTESLKTIDNAVLVLCIDDEVPVDYDREAALVLHGNNGLNRWFDKHNLICFGDGQVGVTYEHSFSDGATWNKIMNDVWCDAHDMEPPRGSEMLQADTIDSLPQPTLLQWDVPPSVASAAEIVSQQVKEACEAVDVRVLDFQEFGKKGFQKMKASPDPTIQLAFMLAYTRLHPDEPYPAVYEAGSMNNFFHGRTETIRSLSSAAVTFLEAMKDPTVDDESKIQALKDAIAVHSNLGNEARSGNGIDRHLLALRSRDVTHPLFEDKYFKQSKQWLLSTSNVSIGCNRSLTFGPVELHG